MTEDDCRALEANRPGARRIAVELSLYETEVSGWRGRLSTGGVWGIMGRDPDDPRHMVTLPCAVDVGEEPMRAGERRLATLEIPGDPEVLRIVEAMGTFYLRGVQGNVGVATLAGCSSRDPERRQR